MTEEEVKSLAIDSFRLIVANERIITDLPRPKQKAAEAKMRNLRNLLHSHIIKLLQNNDIEMVVYEGKPYDANYPLRATNADEFADGEKLVVWETLEPALVKEGRVLHFAKVVLTRAEDFNKQQEQKNVSGN
ncbi:hypothetical protein [Candidatus Spongiihabitans sp.]|uniref:hypothetical protein n=1 Tax=Candidatus Spongiihabitans sp. TaxID=3101308 RepID=UPI003C7D035D